jgi:uncharacterized protein
MTRAAPAPSAVIADTRRWLERAVIGLNLCPFAKAVHVRGQIRWVVSAATDVEALALDLRRELLALHAADPAQVDTTLLIHPQVLADFGAYNRFLGVAEAIVAKLGLEGELQVASFHPGYRFAGTRASDAANFSNRSPFPMLHLLREASIERAVATFADAARIYERNIDTLRSLGPAGWRRLWLDDDADDTTPRKP